MQECYITRYKNPLLRNTMDIEDILLVLWYLHYLATRLNYQLLFKITFQINRLSTGQPSAVLLSGTPIPAHIRADNGNY